MLNTVWFGVLLMVFYAFYTLTMLTFYATFSEVTETEGDVVFLSNVKSVCDVVYFILGYALVPAFVSMGVNIRYVALIFLPLSLFMLIPMFLLKEEPTNKPAPVREGEVAEKPLTLWKAIAVRQCADIRRFYRYLHRQGVRHDRGHGLRTVTRGSFE